ncbi:MAG: DNA topoisomerase VI subunit B [Nanoarchaeota archaeon]|nr:DNA topoisomerase VI subunit B [Nanoarchaeota archaeon]
MEKKPIAHLMAEQQRDISISQFFERNRHLLGFDNKRKSLLTTIKEAVDNSLDACEEAEVLPEVIVEVVDMGNDRFRVVVEDNGPGIVKKQIPSIFAKLLYGSKFFKLSQTRGQQGIGISASVLYAQLTTGKPAKITSRISADDPAHYYELHIDTNTNKPDIVKDEVVNWKKEHGTRVELELEGSYQQGSQSVDQYLKQTAIVNPHVTIIYTNPRAEQLIFARATDQLPVKAKEIKPHPYGVELGVLIRMMKNTEARSLQSFLCTEFSRVGPGTAKEICSHGALVPTTKPKDVSRDMAEKLLTGINATKIIAPPTDCISAIGEELLEKGIRKEINAEFYCSVSRRPEVYRGNPFVIEVGLAYGGELSADDPIKVFRYANRVPLLFQQGACSVSKSIIATGWKSYGLHQSRGALPVGPMALVIHIGSVWVPFTSESKEAVAHYPEIIKEIKLALQDIGRKLATYVRKKHSIQIEGKKRSYLEKYIPHVASALKDLLGYQDDEEKKVCEMLETILEHKRGELEEIKVDNPDYDADLAAIGKDDKKANEDESDEEKAKDGESDEKKVADTPEDSTNESTDESEKNDDKQTTLGEKK